MGGTPSRNPSLMRRHVRFQDHAAAKPRGYVGAIYITLLPSTSNSSSFSPSIFIFKSSYEKYRKMPGNFHISAHNIELEHGHKLKCKLRNNGGNEMESKIDLNDYIGNSDGAIPPSNPPPPFYILRNG